MAIIGVRSNWRIKWHADTPSKLGIMMSIKIKSYLLPDCTLVTACRPSYCEN
jgi:hypothetical protein